MLELSVYNQPKINNIGFKAGHTEKRSVENSLKSGMENPMAGAEQLSNQIRAGISFRAFNFRCTPKGYPRTDLIR